MLLFLQCPVWSLNFQKNLKWEKEYNNNCGFFFLIPILIVEILLLNSNSKLTWSERLQGFGRGAINIICITLCLETLIFLDIIKP